MGTIARKRPNFAGRLRTNASPTISLAISSWSGVEGQLQRYTVPTELSYLLLWWCFININKFQVTAPRIATTILWCCFENSSISKRGECIFPENSMEDTGYSLPKSVFFAINIDLAANVRKVSTATLVTGSLWSSHSQYAGSLSVLYFQARKSPSSCQQPVQTSSRSATHAPWTLARGRLPIEYHQVVYDHKRKRIRTICNGVYPDTCNNSIRAHCTTTALSTNSLHVDSSITIEITSISGTSPSTTYRNLP